MGARQCFFVLMLLAVWSNVAADPVVKPEEFAVAKAQAQADKANDPSGCYMECEFDPFFALRFHGIMGDCFKTVKTPEIETFVTVLALDGGGRVQKAWLNKDTNLSQCALRSIMAMQFPQPPLVPYHARITVNLE